MSCTGGKKEGLLANTETAGDEGVKEAFASVQRRNQLTVQKRKVAEGETADDSLILRERKSQKLADNEDDDDSALNSIWGSCFSASLGLFNRCGHRGGPFDSRCTGVVGNRQISGGNVLEGGTAGGQFIVDCFLISFFGGACVEIRQSPDRPTDGGAASWHLLNIPGSAARQAPQPL